MSSRVEPSLVRADEELRAAVALLADDRCDPVSARDHLADGWRLLDAIGASGSADAGQRLVAAADRPALVDECGALAAAVGRAVAGESDLSRRRRLRWLARGLAATGLVVAALLLLRPPSVATGSGPWRGAYYLNRHFHGAPELARDPAVAFDWGDGPARLGYSRDWFSVRWDSCLRVDRATALELRLFSDDRARLYIDGELAVDNWTEGSSTVQASALVAPGSHHLRVDYVELQGPARIRLTASVDGGPMQPLPVALLQFPGWDEPADGFCAAASSAASRSGSSD